MLHYLTAVSMEHPHTTSYQDTVSVPVHVSTRITIDTLQYSWSVHFTVLRGRPRWKKVRILSGSHLSEAPALSLQASLFLIRFSLHNS